MKIDFPSVSSDSFRRNSAQSTRMIFPRTFQTSKPPQILVRHYEKTQLGGPAGPPPDPPDLRGGAPPPTPPQYVGLRPPAFSDI